jgi:hypothetical protein
MADDLIKSRLKRGVLDSTVEALLGKPDLRFQVKNSSGYAEQFRKVSLDDSVLLYRLQDGLLKEEGAALLYLLFDKTGHLKDSQVDQR